MQWNKKYTSSDRSKAEETSKSDQSKTLELKTEAPSEKASALNERTLHDSRSVTKIDETRRSSHDSFDSFEPVGALHSIDQPSDSTDVKPMDVYDAKTEPTHSKASLGGACIILIISLIFIVLAISSYFALNTAVDLAASLAAGFGLFVFGILGMMLLLIGLIFLGVALSERSSNN